MNPTYFPTPQAVINSMLEYLPESGLAGEFILDPSAGDGRLLDAVKLRRHRYRAPVLMFCETDANLRYVLSGKGHQCVGDDFLSFSGVGVLVNFILMNPPFNNGEGTKHVLHAWEVVAGGGRVVALLPTNYLSKQDRHSQKLSKLVEAHGDVKRLGLVFVDAERKTKVDVSLLCLDKPEDTKFFDALFQRSAFVAPRETDAPEIREDQLASRDNIARLESAYRAALGSYSTVVKSMREISQYLGEFSSPCEIKSILKDILGQGSMLTDDRRKFAVAYQNTYSEFGQAMRLRAWDKVFQDTKIGVLMTTSVRKQFDALQAQQRSVEFSVENVNKLIQVLIDSREAIAENVIVEVFDGLRRYHYGNTSHYEGWKTDKNWRVGYKFILPYMVESDKWFMRLYFRSGDTLTDIDRAMCVVSGQQLGDIVGTYAAMGTALNQGRQDGESTFFTFKCYKKGTAHFQFRDRKICDDFNRLAAKGKWEVGYDAK